MQTDAAALSADALPPRELPPVQAAREELAARAIAVSSDDGVHATTLPGVDVIRAGRPSQPLPSVYHPSVCLVVQGRKHALFDGRTYVYDTRHCLVLSTSLPITGRVVDASPARPYLCLRIDLDPRIVDELLPQLGPATPAQPAPGQPPLIQARTTPELLDAALRLMRLLDAPATAPLLAPLILREVHVRLLAGELGPSLRTLCAADGRVRRVDRALVLLRQRYAESLRVEDLAEAAHMSPSALYAHFRAVTAMSPLQFQKRLRLQEARRLMLSAGLDAADAARRVGYESPSHFGRDYRRLFGAPPRQDVQRTQSAD